MKEIQLTQGRVALVDDDDFDYLNQWKWFALKGRHTYYAARTTRVKNGNTLKGVIIYMHREVVRASRLMVDHRDGNGLNNQKTNLRYCTQRQNSQNRRSAGKSKYLGVMCIKVRTAYVKKDGVESRHEYDRITAIIKTNGKQKRLGYYKSEEEAARAYDEAARKYHGEFANLNFK